MSGKSVVGSLRVTLGLDSAQFQTGLQNAQTGLQRFGSIAKTAALAVTAAMVAAGGAIGVAMKGVLDDADAMSKMSQSIGVPIEELSRLRYAADLSGVSMDKLGVGLKRLSAGMVDLARGDSSAAAKAMQSLGISAQDASGKMRPTTAVIADVAARFATMENGAQKTALAMEIFGKSGADMIPLLNGGAEGLRDMYAEAEELGLVLDEQTGKAAEAFNDNLTRLGKVKDGIVTKITAGMLPSMLSLSEALVGASKDSDLMSTVGKILGNVVRSLVTVAAYAGAAFAGLAAEIGGAYNMASKFIKGDFSGGIEAYRAGMSKSQTILEGVQDFVKTLWEPPSGEPATLTAAAGATDGLASATGRASRATRGLSADQRAAARAARGMTDEQRAAEKSARDLDAAAARIFEQTRSPAERFARDLTELNDIMKAGKTDAVTYTRALGDLLKAYNEANQRRLDDMPIDPLAEKLKNQRIAQDQLQQQLAEDAEIAARDYQRSMYTATYDGIAGGLYAAADGDLGKYLAARLKANLIDGLAKSLTDALGQRGGGFSGGGLASMVGSFFGGGQQLPGFARGGTFTPKSAGGVP